MKKGANNNPWNPFLEMKRSVFIRMPICQTCFSEVKIYDSELKPEVSSIKSSFLWTKTEFHPPSQDPDVGSGGKGI